MRWAGTHDGERLQRDAGQFRCNDRQVQNLDQDCAGRGLHLREICSLHTCRDVQRGQKLWVLKLQHTVAEWTPCVAPDDSGEGSMAVVDSVLRIASGRQDPTPCNSGIIILMALHTALLEGGGQECAGAE